MPSLLARGGTTVAERANCGVLPGGAGTEAPSRLPALRDRALVRKIGSAIARMPALPQGRERRERVGPQPSVSNATQIVPTDHEVWLTRAWADRKVGRKAPREAGHRRSLRRVRYEARLRGVLSLCL